MFEEKMFYIEPPQADASLEQWDAWMRRDAAKRRGAKAAATRKLEYADTPDDLQESGMRKVNGRWQQCLSIGFTGSAEDESLQGEVAVEATQEREAVSLRMSRESNRRGKRTAEQRKARRKKRKQNARRKKAAKE